MESDAFFRQYTSQDEIAKYTRRTAGHGIAYLFLIGSHNGIGGRYGWHRMVYAQKP
jgi:hypothetical protein